MRGRTAIALQNASILVPLFGTQPSVILKTSFVVYINVCLTRLPFRYKVRLVKFTFVQTTRCMN